MVVLQRYLWSPTGRPIFLIRTTNEKKSSTYIGNSYNNSIIQNINPLEKKTSITNCMYLYFILVWFLLLGCTGLQISRAPTSSHKELSKSADKDDFQSGIQGFIRNFEKIQEQTAGDTLGTSGTQIQSHALMQKDLGVSAAGTDYVYGGGESERVDNRPKSGTSEFKINTGFNVGLRWRPIRTKQKIKKLLFYFPRVILKKTKSFLENRVLPSKDGNQESNKWEYTNDDDANYGYDNYNDDGNYDNEEESCENDVDLEWEDGFCQEDRYPWDNEKEPKSQRIKVYGRPGVSVQDTAKKARVFQENEQATKFLPQGMEYSSTPGSLIIPIDTMTKETNDVITEQKQSGSEFDRDKIYSSIKNGGNEGMSESNFSAIENNSIQKNDPVQFEGDSNDMSHRANHMNEEPSSVDPEEVNLNKERLGVFVGAKAPNDGSGTEGVKFDVINPIPPPEEEEEPEYVLVDNSILVNEICPHMPNHFRSSRQEPGKTQDVLVTVFRQPPSSRLTRSRPRHEETFFPTDHIFASSTLSGRIRRQNLMMWLLFAQLIY